jgi:Cellulose binding domain.
LGDSFSGETLTFNGSSHIDETIDVALTVTDTEGATDSITREITIDNYPLPIASPPPVPDYDIFASSTSGDAPLTVDFELSDDFDWNEVDWYVDGERLVTAGPTNFSHTFEQPGTYEVMTYAVYIFDTTCDRRVGREAYITIEVLGDDPDTGGQSCEYVVTNDWGSGFTAELRYTNTGEAIISDWSATWEYTDGSSISSSWNGSVSGSNPYTATGVGWNSSLQPGQTATIGMQGVNGANSAATPTCQ